MFTVKRDKIWYSHGHKFSKSAFLKPLQTLCFILSFSLPPTKMVSSDQQRLELLAGLAATAQALRNSATTLAGAVEIMRQCATAVEGWAEGVKSSNGKRKAADDDDEPVNGKRKRNSVKKKDPNAPKRPASSYLLYQNDVRKEIKEKFPEMSNTELLNLIKTNWATMPEAQKAVYSDRMTKEKERYNAEKTAYEARSPEEVARADAEVAAAIALKKATPRTRKPKAEKVAAPITPAAVPSSDDEDEDDDDDEPDTTPSRAPAAAPRPSSSDSSEEEDDDDDDDEEDDEPVAKKAKTMPKPVPAPTPVVKEKKKKSNKA